MVVEASLVSAAFEGSPFSASFGSGVAANAEQPSGQALGTTNDSALFTCGLTTNVRRDATDVGAAVVAVEIAPLGSSSNHCAASTDTELLLVPLPLGATAAAAVLRPTADEKV